ncbi:uncharacterized protein LOC128200252 isoform X2 [Galleria mellonella]|uniref:Uncharacterized protein LOC128200252 isoform X2 n=1 Tax=Galleria mellonella TaxID=7137 RepID=A0ABM3MCW8_GALME|nr:uncharacterized protein LOC128200252 isoform X2 [Galleria mellonella]
MSHNKLLLHPARIHVTNKLLDVSKHLRNYVNILRHKTTKPKTASSVYRSMNIFDRKAKALQRERSARRDDYHLVEHIKEEVGWRTADRVFDIKRTFKNAVELGASRGYVSRHFLPDSVEKITLCDTSQTHLDKAIVGDGVQVEKLVMDEENIDVSVKRVKIEDLIFMVSREQFRLSSIITSAALGERPAGLLRQNYEVANARWGLHGNSIRRRYADGAPTGVTVGRHRTVGWYGTAHIPVHKDTRHWRPTDGGRFHSTNSGCRFNDVVVPERVARDVGRARHGRVQRGTHAPSTVEPRRAILRRRHLRRDVWQGFS